MVTASTPVRQRSRGPASYGVLRHRLRFLGPVHWARKCSPKSIPQAPGVFVEVMSEPRILGQDVCPVAPSNMWQSEEVAAMCESLRGHTTALPRAPPAQPSNDRPAASLAMLHGGPRAWCWVIVALELHSSALRMYDCGGATELTVCHADLEALHLGALSGDGGTALYLQGTFVRSAALRFRKHYKRVAFRLVMAETMAPWLRAFSPSRWTVVGDREKFSDAWRQWVEGQFPAEGMLHLPQPPLVPPVRPAALAVAGAMAITKAAPKPPQKKSLSVPNGSYPNFKVAPKQFGGQLATEQRGASGLDVRPWSKVEEAG